MGVGVKVGVGIEYVTLVVQVAEAKPGLAKSAVIVLEPVPVKPCGIETLEYDPPLTSVIFEVGEISGRDAVPPVDGPTLKLTVNPVNGVPEVFVK